MHLQVATQLPTRRPGAGVEVPDPCVVVIAGPRLGHCIHVHEVPVILGRDPEADFQLNDPSVSRTHCAIWREGRTTLVRDLQSKNGTAINGELVSRAELQEGDQIALGDAVLKFVSGRLETRYHEALFGLATLDTLTQLLNRRQFRSVLDDAVAAGVPLAVAIVDVDHFKRVNDAAGHDAGDVMLKSIATCLHDCVGAGDAAGRLGGDEFAVLLRDFPLAEAIAWAEGLRRCVGGLPGGVSVSVGLATSAGRGGSGDLLHAADMALLAAKQAGRDTVRWAD